MYSTVEASFIFCKIMKRDGSRASGRGASGAFKQTLLSSGYCFRLYIRKKAVLIQVFAYLKAGYCAIYFHFEHELIAESASASSVLQEDSSLLVVPLKCKLMCHSTNNSSLWWDRMVISSMAEITVPIWSLLLEWLTSTDGRKAAVIAMLRDLRLWLS